MCETDLFIALKNTNNLGAKTNVILYKFCCDLALYRKLFQLRAPKSLNAFDVPTYV